MRLAQFARVTVLLIGLGAVIPACAEEPYPSFVPKNGFVPTAEVAIRIAVAIWEPIYGADQISKEKPYRATLAGGVWTVQGSLPPTVVGGVAFVQILQADGRILRAIHGK
jgi:hypothetical protein